MCLALVYSYLGLRDASSALANVAYQNITNEKFSDRTSSTKSNIGR
ncbi:hypothetical protein KBT16_10325 [Nostoc sp. CCCryo 231-06]|nr:hypothetical protein [Nostoc sp. CCCryo 231-06]